MKHAKKAVVSSTNTPARKIAAPVTGQIVAAEGLNLEFGAAGRKSAYDDLLNRLIEAAPGHVLKFADTRCRATVAARAKKLGLRVLFAESAGALYVQISRVEPKALTRTTKLTLADAVRRVVSEAPRTNGEVFDHVRQILPDAVRGSVDATLSNLRDKNEVAKKDDLKWYPIRKAQ